MQFVANFDRIEIINLKNRHDRRRDLAKQVSRIGREIDGDTIRFYNAIRPSEQGKFPSIGARGCFESHLNILRRARDDGVNKLLIIEDDLNFSDDINDLSPKFYAFLKEQEWDFSYLAHSHEKVDACNKQEPITLDENISILCTHLIGISGNVLHELVEYLERMSMRGAGHPDGGPMHIDGAYNWFRRDSHCKTVFAVPPLGYQRSSRSDVAKIKVYDQLPVIRNMIEFIRMLKNKYRSRWRAFRILWQHVIDSFNRSKFRAVSSRISKRISGF